MRLRLALLVGTVAALLGAGVAGGAETAATPWPVTRILVWNETQYRQAGLEAIAAWNAVGTRVTLAPARTRGAARVVISYLGGTTERSKLGEGTLGWSPSARGDVRVAPGLGHRLAAAVIAHELGHVLGLGHRAAGCSVMRAVVEVDLPRDPCGVARCTPVSACLVQPVDAAALVDLYEHRLPTLVPREPLDVSVRVAGRASGVVGVHWRSPLAGPGNAVLVRAAQGRCPTNPYAEPIARTSVVPLARGAQQEAWVAVTGPGRWCVAVWVQDQRSFLTSRPARVGVDVG